MRHGLIPPILTVALFALGCGAPGEEHDILARYDGGRVTRDEFVEFLGSLDKKYVKTDAELPEAEGLEQLLRRYTAEKILASEVDDAEIIEGEEFLYLTPKAWHLVNYYKIRLGRRSYQIGDSEVMARYQERKEERFHLPEKITFQHVFLRRDRHDEREFKALRTTILSRLEAGEPFDSLVAEFSESAGGEENGVVGPLFRGKLDEQFEEEVYRHQPSDPPFVVETPLGIHVVRIIERQPRRLMSFEEAKPQIISALMSERGDQEKQELLDSLRSRYEVEYLGMDSDIAADAVILRIGDKSATKREVEEFIAGLPPARDLAPHQLAELRDRALSHIIDNTLLYLDALDQGLDKEDNFRTGWRLRMMGLKYRRALEKRLKERVAAIPDEEITAYLEEHSNRFVLPKMYEISYVFLPFEGADPFTVWTRAEEAVAELEAEGAGSERLRQLCEQAGGILVEPVLITHNRAVVLGPDFMKAIKKLRPNEVSQPFKTDEGVFVVALHDLRQSRAMEPPGDMDDVRRRFLELSRKELVGRLNDEALEQHEFTMLRTSVFTDDTDDGRE